MFKKHFYLFFIALIGLTASAQQLNTVKLDSLFQTLESNNRYMGSISIMQDGQDIYSKAIGYADIETGKKSTTDTKYRVGSITKMFTMALTLKAVEENKLSLSQTIDHYFPNIINAHKITIENLLNHRSGIHNFTNDIAYQNWNTQPKTNKELLEIISKGGSDFEPNSRAQYSNSNYVLLTFILEKVFKISYAELLKEKITEPIGLKDTYMGSTINLGQNECNSYSFSGNWIKRNETHMSIPLGAGAIVSNPTDLNIFIKTFFAGKILSQENLELIKTIEDGYGMGIFEVPFNDKKGYGHNGGIDGFTSVLAYFPEDKLSVALTSNGSNYANNEIVIKALSSFYGIPFEIPTFKSIEVKTEDLDKYLGVYAREQLPLKITITKKENTLIGQATGQPSFPMDAVELDVFEFLPAGVRLEFDTIGNAMTLKQAGGVFEFIKE